MANVIPMGTQQAIRALHEQNYSQRQIARRLKINRRTVKRYLAMPSPDELSSTSESETLDDSKCTISTPGSPASDKDGSPPGSGSGRISHCVAFADVIEAKLEQGLQATRIWQDLVEEHKFQHSYQSVKRWVAKHDSTPPKRVYRVECLPGEEAQIDYGTYMLTIGGKKKKIHFLRVVLSYSRKGYTEAMPRQDTESFIRGIENAFRAFEGVPCILGLDNLKAGVLKADFYDPQLNPKFASFCLHYNTVAMPVRPATPQHNGKVERSVPYVKESALKAREFDSLGELNKYLRKWDNTVADKRIHGTTKRQVGSHFLEVEKPMLGALPPDLFPSFSEAPRKVHRDGYIEFERAYYDVPAEYIQRKVWVRSDGRMLRVFNLDLNQVAVHVKLKPGQRSEALGCRGTDISVARSLEKLQERASAIGPETGLWAKALIINRKEAALRPLTGLLNNLRRDYSNTTLEKACKQARLHGQYTLKELRARLEDPANPQQHFEFLTENEIIRDLSAYTAISEASSFSSHQSKANQP